ncbi:MAG: hypothetical protein ACREQC_05445, partial [Candidatus Binataceae bacterium]
MAGYGKIGALRQRPQFTIAKTTVIIDPKIMIVTDGNIVGTSLTVVFGTLPIETPSCPLCEMSRG